MRFAFTEQQLELRGAVRQVLASECTPADLRALHERPPEPAAGPALGRADPGRTSARWAVLAELGAPGLLAPEAHGGLGLDEVDLTGVLEEAGRVALPEPLGESAGLVVPALAGLLELPGAGADAGADPGKVARWLGAVAHGEAVATVGGVEVGRAGPVLTTAPLDPDAQLPDAVPCRTPRVVASDRADVALLVAPGAGGGLEVHLVEAAAARRLPTPSIDGPRRPGEWEWVPSPETRLASGGAAAVLVGSLVDRGALVAASQLLGLADRMIAMAAAYAVDRKQFGRPIGSFQAVKHLLADARVRLEFARPATYRAAESIARGRPGRAAHAAMAKALASDAADLAARVALQVHGAIGYTWECDLHLFMKHTWALSASWGDAVTQRARVLAEALAGRSG